MIRVIIFLVLVGAAAVGAAWVADQTGDVTLVLSGWRIQTSVPIFILALGVVVVLAMLIWSAVRALWLMPRRVRRLRQAQRHARGRHAVTQGLIAIGTGDPHAARRHADAARRLAQQDPLTLLLHAQAAQLSGDHTAAQQAFHNMAGREETRLLGLRGLFIEAQRSDDPVAAVAIAEEALKLAPAATWASHAVLGFRCAQGDWTGALAILERDQASGRIDKAMYARHRAVLLTARAMELATSERDVARDNALEAVKLAPTLVPAATLAAKFMSEANQIRRAMRILEVAWRAHPHPDLADAYAHVRLGDSARQRLTRIEALAAKTPGDVEGALAVARAAIDATAYGRAREALAPLLAAPTQRVALLMAEIERGEHGDSGAARSWMDRAVRALHDPAWTADGYVSERWRPVSPVTGRLDAFQWMIPVAALPSERAAAIEVAAAIADPQGHPPVRTAIAGSEAVVGVGPIDAELAEAKSFETRIPEASAGASPPVEAAMPAAAAPMFRPRRDFSTGGREATPPVIPQIIPLVHAPDDPGVDDGADFDGVDDMASDRPTGGQAGGFRGFLSRLMG